MKEIDFYDHAHSRNPVIRYLVSRYLKSASSILWGLRLEGGLGLDVGCGGGYITDWLSWELCPVVGIDSSPGRIEVAKSRYGYLDFRIADGNSLPFENGRFKLVVSTQVLEHQENPDRFIGELNRVSDRYVFLSVPDNLLWRLGNIARGKYWLRLGSPKGHIKDWNKGSLERFLTRYFPRVKVRRCFIWLIALCEK